MPQFLFLFSSVLFSSTYSLSSRAFFFFFFFLHLFYVHTINHFYISPFSFFTCFVSSSSYYFISSTVNSLSLFSIQHLSLYLSCGFFYFFFWGGGGVGGEFKGWAFFILVNWANFCNFPIGEFVIRLCFWGVCYF